MRNGMKDNFTELISIIIPVYNVEKYLRECIDSVLAQTYKELEIILVDDGSKDNSGAICDEYAKLDKRIKVIHQKNRGLSGARTAGQEIARGKFITFIDSDDWVREDMMEVLYHDIKYYDADISCIAFEMVYDDGTSVKGTSVTETQILDRVKALECYLFDGYIGPCICGKLWKKDLWNGIRCPEGKLFEDQYTTYKLLDKANKIIFNPESKYYYRKHDSSIGHSRFSQRTYDLYYGIQEAYEYITNRYSDINETLAIGKIKWEIVFINMMICDGKTDEEILKKCKYFARSRTRDIIQCRYIDCVRKFQMLLFAYNFWLYKKVYLLYKKSHPIA